MTDFLSTSPNSMMIEQMCLNMTPKEAEEWVDSSMVVADASTFGGQWGFAVKETDTAGDWGSYVTISGSNTGSIALGQKIAEGINSNSNLTHTKATWNPTLNRLTIVHELGGEIAFSNNAGYGGVSNPLETLGFQTNVGLYSAPMGSQADYDYLATNWKPLVEFGSKLIAIKIAKAATANGLDMGTVDLPPGDICNGMRVINTKLLIITISFFIFIE